MPATPNDGPHGNAFSGEVNWVQIDLKQDDHDHLISPEERFRVAMARQWAMRSDGAVCRGAREAWSWSLQH